MTHERWSGQCRAQSESIGVILLTGIVVIAVTTLGVAIYGDVAAEETTRADLDAVIEQRGVVVSHRGGDPVELSDLRVVVSNETRRWVLSGTQGFVPGGSSNDDPAAFEPGETWFNVSFAFSQDEVVTVGVYDVRTGTRLGSAEQYPATSLPEISSLSAADVVVLHGYDAAASTPSNGNVTFEIANDGYENVTVTKVAVNVSNQSVAYLDEDNENLLSAPAPGNVEVHVDASTVGYYEGGDDALSVDGLPADGTSVALDDAATLEAQTHSMMTWYQFVDADGNTVDVSGMTLHVTVTYADGSSETFAVEVPS